MKRLAPLCLLMPALAFGQATGPLGVFGGPIPSSTLPPASQIGANTYAFTSDQGLQVNNGTSWASAGGTGPGGSTYAIQYNNGSIFGGLLPGSAGQFCLNWSSLSAPPTLVTCSGTVYFGTANQLAYYAANGTTISGTTMLPTAAMPALTGDLSGTAGSLSVTVSQVKGAAIPVSAAVLGTNGGGQLVVASTTGSGSVVLATSPTLTTPNVGTATASGLTLSGITGSTQCLQVNMSGTVSGTGAACGSGSSSAFSSLTGGTNASADMLVGTGASLGPTGGGTVSANEVNGAAAPTSAALTATNSSGQLTGISLGNGLAISSGTLAPTYGVNAQTGTSYAIASTDAAKLVTFNSASGIAVSLPQATGSFGAGFGVDVENLGAGTATITPTTSTINGASSLSISQNRGCSVTSDGTNYQVSACTALVTTSGTGTVTSVAMTVPRGFSVSGSPITTSGTLALSYSGPVVGGTNFTVSGTGCTPSATTGGATAGTITLASGPCTAVTVTMNGTTGLTAPNGWHCNVGDRTALAAGTWIPAWSEDASTTTTATIPIPSAAGSTDVISFACTGY